MTARTTDFVLIPGVFCVYLVFAIYFLIQEIRSVPGLPLLASQANSCWNKGEFCKLILLPQNGWVWLHSLSSCLVWHQSTVSSYRGHNLSLKHLKYQELLRICVILSPFLKGMLLWREEVDGRVTERPFGGQMRFIGLSLSMTTNDLSSSGGFTN